MKKGARTREQEEKKLAEGGGFRKGKGVGIGDWKGSVPRGGGDVVRGVGVAGEKTWCSS